jgi:hypothetical protein
MLPKWKASLCSSMRWRREDAWCISYPVENVAMADPGGNLCRKECFVFLISKCYKKPCVVDISPFKLVCSHPF